MASAVDISNLALGHLGELPTITNLAPPTGGAHAGKAAIFYPIARDAMLEMHDWRFSVRRQALAELDLGDEMPPTWEFAYALPTDCLKPRRVLSPDSLHLDLDWERRQNGDVLTAAGDELGQDFKVEIRSNGTQVIYTNAPEAWLVYTKTITDTTKFSPLFVLALSRLLASFLAGPIIKGAEGRQVAAGMYQIALTVEGSRAMTSDANSRQSNAYTHQVPGAISARR